MEQVGHPGHRVESRQTPVTFPSVQPDRRVEVPGSADQDHVDVVVADGPSMPAAVPEGFELFELDEGRLQPAQLIEDELIVAIPLVPKHARVEDCGSLAREFAELGERP